MYAGDGGESPWDESKLGRCVGPSNAVAAADALAAGFDAAHHDIGGLGVADWDCTTGCSNDLRLSGDFYFEPDDVQRGVAQVTHGFHDSFEGLEPYGSAADALGGDIWDLDCSLYGPPQVPSLLRGSSYQKGSYIVSSEAIFATPFDDNVRPAEVPFGGVSAASLWFHGTSAAEVANSVFCFLTDQLAVSIEKKRIEKFAINAAFPGGHIGGQPCGACEVKARVFGASSGSTDALGAELVLELRRRDGDSHAFGLLSAQVVNYLRQRFGDLCCAAGAQVEPALLQPALPVPAVPSAGDDPLAMLQPLLDGLTASAECGAVPPSQAEAVAALAQLAGASAAGAAAICAGLAGLQGALAALVTSARLDVAYPAALLAIQLAQNGNSGMAETLLQAALQGVGADATNRLVRIELAEAVRLTAQRAQRGAPLKYMLAEVMQTPGARCEAVVADRLNEALCALEALGKADHPYALATSALA